MASLDIFTVLLLIFAGCFSGFSAGLLGIGGGVVIVSAFVYIFSWKFGASEFLQHTAVGTSFAVMVFTGLVNVFAQNKSKNVDWNLVKKFAPFLILGVIVGSIFSLGISEKVLRFLFVIFLYFTAIKMYLDMPQNHTVRDKILRSTGFFIGLFSSWVGIGGGAFMVPFFRYCGNSAHSAIGTSGVLTFPVAVAGAISYLSTGLQVDNSIPNTVGFVYLPGLIILSLCTIFTVPFGSFVKTKISQKALQILFAVMSFSIAILMTIKMFNL